jgi:cell division protein FtsX
MNKPTVFSLVREQSVFMTIIMSLLTFLSVLTLGVALSIGTGVMRWNANWELYATVQVTDSSKVDITKKIINDNSTKIKSAHEITTDQMQDMMSPWISGGNVLKNYLPKMWEIQFQTKDDLKTVGEQLSKNARFLTHATALKSSTSAGWKMIAMSCLILTLILGAISICISFIARNTALLHRRELEILNQIGASDGFVARQMQIIVGRICLTASVIGFFCATPILLLITTTAHSARVGLMAMMGLSVGNWLILAILPVAITVFSIWVTHRTTIKLLQEK